MNDREGAGSVIQRTLIASMGPGAAEQLALAQVRLAWDEAMQHAGLTRGGLRSRIVHVKNGTAQVEASEPMLAQELAMRAEALVWAVNARMSGRPGATIVLRRMTVSVGPAGGTASL